MSQSAIEKLFERWYKNPLLFVKECFTWPEGEKPTKQQEEGLILVGKIAQAKIKSHEGSKLTEEEQGLVNKLGIAIRSGHGVGKDAFLSWIYWWLLSCFPYSVGLVTAPTSHQLGDILWKEFRKWQQTSSFLMNKFEVQSDTVYCKESKGRWFISARTSNIKGGDEEQAETLAGQHGDYMILAVDEASKVPRGVFRPFEGALTGKMNFAIILGNPTRSSGYFYDAFHTDRKNWLCLHWNSEDSEIVSKDHIQRMIDKYGYASNMYRIRVLGEFPLSDSNTLIPDSWVWDAVNRDISVMEHAYKVKGIDVGAGGDVSIIITRIGNKVTDIQKFDSVDTQQVLGWILRDLAEDSDYDYAFIDPIGIGAGVYDSLRAKNIKNVISVDVRRSSSNPSYFRLRDEIYWRLREQFENSTISIPDDEELIVELFSIKYDVPDTTKGAVKIESKKDMRTRGLHSPNKADALALTYYYDNLIYKSMGKLTEKSKKAQQKYNWRTI